MITPVVRGTCPLQRGAIMTLVGYGLLPAAGNRASSRLAVQLRVGRLMCCASARARRRQGVARLPPGRCHLHMFLPGQRLHSRQVPRLQQRSKRHRASDTISSVRWIAPRSSACWRQSLAVSPSVLRFTQITDNGSFPPASADRVMIFTFSRLSAIRQERAAMILRNSCNLRAVRHPSCSPAHLDAPEDAGGGIYIPFIPFMPPPFIPSIPFVPL